MFDRTVAAHRRLTPVPAGAVVLYAADLQPENATVQCRAFFGAWPDLGAPDRLGVPAAVHAMVRDAVHGMRVDDERHSVLLLPDLMARLSRLTGGDEPRLYAMFNRFAVRDAAGTARERYGLTQREVDVVRLLLKGKTVAEIAGDLTLSENTISDHLKALRRKTTTRSLSGLIALLLGGP